MRNTSILTTKYYVRRPFDYKGEETDRGELLELKGARKKDEELVRLGYLVALPRGVATKECSFCLKRFIDERSRTGTHKCDTVTGVMA